MTALFTSYVTERTYVKAVVQLIHIANGQWQYLEDLLNT